MCYTIKSENLLANYFANTDNEDITFRRLKELRKEIETIFNNRIYVDITYDAVNKAIWSNKDFYFKEKNSIIIKHEAIHFFKEGSFVEENYNWRIPADIKEKYLHFFESIPDEK